MCVFWNKQMPNEECVESYFRRTWNSPGSASVLDTLKKQPQKTNSKADIPEPWCVTMFAYRGCWYIMFTNAEQPQLLIGFPILFIQHPKNVVRERANTL